MAGVQLNHAATGEELDEADDQRHDQQQMDQAAGYVKAETQQPEHDKNDDDSPQHSSAPDGFGGAITNERPIRCEGVSGRSLTIYI